MRRLKKAIKNNNIQFKLGEIGGKGDQGNYFVYKGCASRKLYSGVGQEVSQCRVPRVGK